MNAIGHLPFSTIPGVPMQYLMLTPPATRSLISTKLWMLLVAFLLSWEERRRLVAAAGPRPDLGEKQSDDEGNGKMKTRGQRYRNGTAIRRSERRILEGEIERTITDERDRLKWYRESARELQQPKHQYLH